MDSPLVRDVLVLAVMIIAALGVMVVRRWAPRTLRENNEFTGFTFAFVGLVYGVYLAFTVVIVWEHFEAAESTAASEATRLSELWRDAAVLPGGAAIQNQLYDYTRSVIHDDWPAMAAMKPGSPVTSQKYESLWRTYYAVRLAPADAAQAAFFRESLLQLNELGRERRMRVHAGAADIPPMMWGLLIAGGIGMVGFTYLIGTEHAWVQIIVTAFLAGILAWAVLIVFALADPYSGDVSVSADAFVGVLQSFDARRAEAPAPPR
ncbi:MAG TPA: DUF4239 domain-containing protein [Thermoanaerobaculia bacterium]|nr:DUF4239 domain-containing protein [Thermoanaerobaculia bacterium]